MVGDWTGKDRSPVDFFLSSFSSSSFSLTQSVAEGSAGDPLESGASVVVLLLLVLTRSELADERLLARSSALFRTEEGRL